MSGDVRPATAWTLPLRSDPLPWLLDESTPAVRHLALRRLLDLPASDAAVGAAQAAAMTSDPICATLAAQDPAGFWVKPGPGYAPKYRGTVWSLIFLDQLGADPNDPRIRAACEYVLSHSRAVSGGFSASGQLRETAPPPSGVIHCLNGNLLRALIGFGWCDDPRVQAAIAWEMGAILGTREIAFFKSGTTGPGFRCAANEGLPCAWGAAKALLALVRIPAERRSADVQAAIDRAVDFLLSVDPATAAYPAGWGNEKPSGSWFRLGFPSGYVGDVLQVVEAVCAAGHGGDPRLANAIEWMLSKQDAQGRWRNEYAYNGKTWIDFESQGAPSKWVTLRACGVLKAIHDSRHGSSPG